MEIITGIVVKTLKYNENSKIVYVVTENGLESYLCRGASKLKSKNTSYSQALTKIAFNFQNSKRGFPILTSGTVVKDYANSKFNLERMASSMVVLDYLYQFTEHITEKKQLFEFSDLILSKIDSSKYYKIYELIFKLKLLYLLGVGPIFTKCIRCGEKVDLIGFDLASGGMRCVNCSNVNINYYNNETIAIAKVLYLIKIPIVDEAIFEKCISLESQIDEFVKAYYQQYLGFASMASKIIDDILIKK